VHVDFVDGQFVFTTSRQPGADDKAPEALEAAS
jgi:hypothetical protein